MNHDQNTNVRAPLGAVLRMNTVTEITGMSRATIYRKIKDGTFPLARQLGANSVGWLEREISDWIEKRPTVQT